MNKINVCVLFGGQSPEHEVSLVSASNIINSLDKNKYRIITVGITKEGKWLLFKGDSEDIKNNRWNNGMLAQVYLTPDATQGRLIIAKENEPVTYIDIDLIFPALHGACGEDGTIQGLCTMARIPFVGSGVLASAICMDKAYTKIILKDIKIPQADWMVIPSYQMDHLDELIQAAEEKFSYPIFVKPSATGSSVGISKVYDKIGFKNAVIYALKFSDKVLIEEYIPGREIECSVLGNQKPEASCVLGEIIPSNEFYDYDAKYNSDDSKLIIPAVLDDKTADEIKQYSLQAYSALGCKGLARIDFFVHKKTNQIYLNEINTLPGFTPISMYPMLWEKSGLSKASLIDCLIDLALEV